MEFEIKNLSITDLFLDQNNIRTPINSSDQSALIKDMFDNEDAIQLVKSFVQNGLFPDELPIAVLENDMYIVLEGNRRLSALKALATPELAPDNYQSQIKKLANPDIKRLNVVVMPDRESALKHIANKHTINYRRNWKPLRQAYFYKSQQKNGKNLKQLIKEYPEQDVVKFIKMFEMHHLAKSVPADDSVKFFVFDDRNFPISTFERFYNNKSIQEYLNIRFSKIGKVFVEGKKSIFLKKLELILLDIYNKKADSRTLNRQSDIDTYAKSLPNFESKNTLPKNASPDIGEAKSLNGKDKEPAKSGSRAKSTAAFKEQPKPKSGIQRSYKVPKSLFRSSDVPFRLRNSSLRQLYEEIRKLPVATYPNATYDFLRSFLECSLVVFLKSSGDFDTVQKNKKHNPSIGEMIQYIVDGKCNTIKDKNLIEALRLKKTQFDSKFSMARLHNINHNELYNSTEQEVRTMWGLLEPLFKAILNPE